MQRRFAAGLVFAVVFWTVTASSQVTTGTISGNVKDPSGALLPGVKVVILNENTGISREMTTDAAGRYSASLLGLGDYRVAASLQGFQTEIRSGIVLTVGREAVVDLQLSVGSVNETVEVTAEAPLVQTAESAVGYLVADRAIRDLPLNGRDLTQLILLNPGVSMALNSRADSSGVGFGKRISISGLRGEDNAYLLDGSYINDFGRHIPAGPSGALLGAETVREFQVLTNSYSAQYGRAMGGVFNAVSKSGTNEWHGSIYEYLRNSALDARDFFDRKQLPDDPRLPPFRRNQFGGTAGGPIKRDRTFFFAAFEGMRESLTRTVIAVVPNENARRGILPTETLPVSPVIAGFFSYFPLPSPQGRRFPADGTAEHIFAARQPTTDNFGQGRVDHQISASDSIYARFTGSGSNRSFQNYPGYETLSGLSARLLTLSETHIFSARALETLRFSFNRVFPFDSILGPHGPALVTSVPGQEVAGISPGNGVTGFGNGMGPGTRWVSNRYNVQDDLNYTVSAHALKFGGYFERMQLNQNQPNRPNGTWTFASLRDFLLMIPSNYRGTPPLSGSGSYRGMRQSFWGLYLQDDWQVMPRLTLNLGVRLDAFTVPTEVNGLLVNLRHRDDPKPTIGDPYWKKNSFADYSPRFGFAWTPFAGGRTSVRGGIGVYYLALDPAVWYRGLARMAPLFPEYNFANPKNFPDALAAIAAASVTSFGQAFVVPFTHFKSPHAVQYNMNVQQQVGRSSVLAVGYVGSRGMNETGLANWNMPDARYNGNSLEFPANATKFNPNFEALSFYADDGNSFYNGMTVSFQRRFSGGLQTQVSYTWSKTINENDGNNTGQNVTSSDFSTLKYTYDSKVNRGLSGYGVPQVFSLNYSYDAPFGRNWSGIAGHLASGWQITGIITVQTGQPFTVTAGVPAALTSLTVAARSPNVAASRKRSDIIKGGPNQYFDPLAFTAPGARELGNAGRNTLIGPGLAKWDFGLSKNTFVSERWKLQFRAELFNLLNHPNYAGPAASLFTAAGARVQSAGNITQTVSTSRQIQFALRLTY